MPIITFQNYAARFQRLLSIPVKEDPTMPLTAPMRSQLSPGTNFDFKLDDAIQAADRYLAIHGKPSNSVQIVDEWTNVLRWELSTYWESLSGDWYDVRTNGPIHFSPEHPKRSGELLAQGIAILFLERRLMISRSRFFFLDGVTARPDFFIRPQRHTQRAVLLRDRRKMGLEVRSRSGVSSVPKDDKTQIKKKKIAVSNTLAMYCSYGEPSPKRLNPRTKIVLADPPGRSELATDSEVADILLGHYLGVTSRLGLWGHRDALQRHYEEPELSWTKPIKQIQLPKFMLRESFNGQRYIGRFFNDLVSRADQGELSREEAELALRTGRFGPVFFSGIREDVLNAVGRFDWEFLESFCDERGFGEQGPGHKINTDGTIRNEEESVREGSVLWDAVSNSLRNLRRK